MIHINCLLFIFALFLGCSSHYHHNISKTRIVQDFPHDFPDDFEDFTRIEENLTYQEKLIAHECDYDIYDVSISLNDKELTNLRWYYSKRAQKNPRPVEFIWPILAGKKMIVADLYASNIYAPIGIDSVIIRQKEKLFSRRPLRKIEDFTPFHKETVRHMMRAVHWAKQKKNFDSRRFAMTGTSYGGILTAICIPFTSDFVSHKIIMGAGGISSILSESEERGVTRWRTATLRDFSENIRQKLTSKLGALYYEDTQKYEKQIMEAAKKQFIKESKILDRWDPYFFAKYADSKKISMIITLCDVHVPTKNQIMLWKKLGRPETLFLKTGHYTLALAYFQVKSFLRKMSIKYMERKK